MKESLQREEPSCHYVAMHLTPPRGRHYVTGPWNWHTGRLAHPPRGKEKGETEGETPKRDMFSGGGEGDDMPGSARRGVRGPLRRHAGALGART